MKNKYLERTGQETRFFEKTGFHQIRKEILKLVREIWEYPSQPRQDSGKKIIALLAMSFALILFSFALWSQPVLSEETDAFNDISSHWSRHVVNWLAGDNPDNISYLKKEEENFRPGCPITRAEWVAMSMEVLDLANRPNAGQNRVAKAPRCADVPSWPCPFSDISATASANPPQLRSL